MHTYAYMSNIHMSIYTHDILIYTPYKYLDIYSIYTHDTSIYTYIHPYFIILSHAPEGSE